jgi:hypothetical protein
MGKFNTLKMHHLFVVIQVNFYGGIEAIYYYYI